MKYKKQKSLAFAGALGIWALGKLLVPTSALSLCPVVKSWCSYALVYGYSLPLANFMFWVAISFLISLLITQDSLSKKWGVLSIYFLVFSIFFLFTASEVSCDGIAPVLCERTGLSQINGIAYLCLTFIFVLYSILTGGLSYTSKHHK